MWFQGGILLLFVTSAFASHADPNITCAENSVTVIWKLDKELGAQPSRLLLGRCLPTSFSSVPDGVVATFSVFLTDCSFKRVVKGHKIIYKNKLTYRPLAKPFPPKLSYPVVCIYDRPDKWSLPVPISSGSVIGYGGLFFYMGIMNDDLSGPAWPTTFPLGSRIPILAAVDQQSHMPLTVFIEECVATTTPDIGTSPLVYPFITNGGCLIDGKSGSSTFLPRDKKSEIILSLQAFKFGAGEDVSLVSQLLTGFVHVNSLKPHTVLVPLQVYIHCKMTAWDPEMLDENRKACNYIKELEGELHMSFSWELLDDPSQSDLCRCCDTSCNSRKRKNFQGLSHSTVLGPLIVKDVKLK
ncbi:zona pellucida sperm-binding protein 3-like [Arapaima gigas]